MIIAYGVKHYGKENIFVRYGTCENCGYFGQLSSYDTASFFTVFWLPIIPLGGKHIIDSCPSCKTHRELGRRKYYKIKEQEIFNAFNELKEDQGNPEKAVNALNTLIIYHDFDNFRKFTPVIIKKHPHNAFLLKSMGEAYEYIGDYGSAEICYSDAVKAEDTSENRIKLSINLLMQSKPDKAKPYLDHIITSADIDQISHLYLLAVAFRNQGQHKEALDILKKIETVDHDAVNNSEHATLVQSSKDRLTSKEAVPSEILNSKRGVETLRNGLPTWVPQMLPVLLLCLIVGGYLFSAFNKGLSREIFLVNGAAVNYTARINDEEYALHSYSHRRVQLPEGELGIKINGTLFEIPEQTVTIKTPFFSRPFDSRIMVLNPDGLAVLVKETTAYSTKEIKGYEGDFSVYHGRIFYEFTDIDYPFQEFPAEIQMDANKDREYRTRLLSFKPESFDHLIGVLMNRFSDQELAAYLEKYVQIHPEESASLYLLGKLAEITGPDRFIKLIKQGVEKRPILVDWHRYYQTFMDTHHPEHNLVAEYQRYVDAEPGEAYLEYLLGRVIPDPIVADDHFSASEKQAQPIGFGYHAMAYHNLCAGRFKKALDQARMAMSIQPDQINFGWVISNSLLALKQYKLLLEMVRKDREQQYTNSRLAAMEIKYLMLMNQPADAQKVKTEYLQEMAKYDTPENVELVKNYFNANIQYLKGHFDEYGKLIKSSTHQNGAFHASVMKKDADGAVKILEEAGDSAADHYLLVYCIAKETDKEITANRALSKAINLLSSGDSEKRRVAKMFEGDLEEIKKSLKEMCIIPGEKRIIAVTLGLIYPEVRQYCYEIAETQNFDMEFPYQYINQIITKEI